MDLLEVKSISKTYGSGETAVHALKKVSFSVPKGEYVAIVGESGSGKSTLLNMIGALDNPTSGKVLIDGKDIFAMKESKLTIFRRRNIGFIFQAFNLIPELTVEQNIIFPVLLDYQKPDKRDLGTWRLPNEAELMIMAGSLFDWDDREKPKVYDFGGNLSSLNMKDGQVIHSRTGFSKRDMNGGRSFSAGYQMYFDGYLRFVTTVDTQWGGDKDRLVNDKKGYVRCVRDLE